MDIINEVAELIDCKYEGDWWDFKKEHHHNIAELVHDIICLANNRQSRDAYIIFGVCDGNYEICGVENNEGRRTQADIIDILRNPRWAFGIVPQIELVMIKLLGHEIDVCKIKFTNDVPYYLTEDFKRKSEGKERILRANYIYTRVCDTNTPIDRSATPDQVEHLWKCHFGLLSQPLEQMINKLTVPKDWIVYDDEDSGDSIYYNKFAPEYTIRMRWEEPSKYPAFYAYNLDNSDTMDGWVFLMFHTTVLAKIAMVMLDSGRYITPCPEWAFIHDRNHSACYSYKYMLKDSIEYILQSFFFDKKNSDQYYAKQRFNDVVLYFKNIKEQTAFHNLFEGQPEVLEEDIKGQAEQMPHFSTGNKKRDKDIQSRLCVAFALKSLQERICGAQMVP